MDTVKWTLLKRSYLNTVKSDTVRWTPKKYRLSLNLRHSDIDTVKSKGISVIQDTERSTLMNNSPIYRAYLYSDTLSLDSGTLGTQLFTVFVQVMPVFLQFFFSVCPQNLSHLSA